MSRSNLPADHEAFYTMTRLKLHRFGVQKTKTDSIYAETLTKASTASSLLRKAEALLNGWEASVSDDPPNDQRDREIKSIRSFLYQAGTNPCTTDSILNQVCGRLTNELERRKNKTEYNHLFGMILSQWLENQTKTEKGGTADAWVAVDNDGDDGGPQMLEGMETMETPTDAENETSATLQSIIFEKSPIDEAALESFVTEQLFAFEDAAEKKMFEGVQKAVAEFGANLVKRRVSAAEVRASMEALLSSDLLSAGRQAAVRKLTSDDSAVDELATSLTLMIADLDDWNWAPEGVRGVFRRQVSGRYRCFYDEDLVTAIFLQHVGAQWSVFLRQQLLTIQNTIVWHRPKPGHEVDTSSIAHHRTQIQREYYLNGLPTSIESQSFSYDDDNDSTTEKKTSPVEAKQRLMYLVNVEAQLHKYLYPDTPFTVVRTDLAWFGPSISHESITILLKRLGVPQQWLTFFAKFLAVPVFYAPNQPIRVRKRGVPISHSLSFLFAELILAGLDLHVWRKTGIFNYRNHDDFWFFDKEEAKVVDAWKIMREYAELFGLRFNEEKSGSTKVFAGAKEGERVGGDGSLPQGAVQWGFLTLDSNAQFTITPSNLDPFIKEMKENLLCAPSVLHWVTLYNKYTRFFLRNGGLHCARVCTKDHIRRLISVLRDVHLKVFDSHAGNAVQALYDRIRRDFPRFAVKDSDAMEGWVYWPVTAGGLGMVNVWIECLAVETGFGDEEDDEGRVAKTFEWMKVDDREAYEGMQKQVEEMKAQAIVRRERVHGDLGVLFRYSPGGVKARWVRGSEETEWKDLTLVSWKEFSSDRETQFARWGSRYNTLLETIDPEGPEINDSLLLRINQFRKSDAALKPKKSKSSGRGSYVPDVVPDVEAYEVDYGTGWLVGFYGEDMCNVVGGMEFMDPESLPLGLISMMRSARVKFD
ncbi:hypothetical protein HDV00_009578 [Rhizophlyctis rosea]|nr:hypothetical protein HDV00_009578 [Rhizophlyctis rosea]